MTGLLAVIFVIVPFAEVVLVLAVADEIGVGATILALILISVVGAVLAKQQGLVVWGRLRSAIRRGEVPSREVTEGFLVLVGGALLLTPGFLTDFLGILLLLPPSRALVRARLLQRFESRLGVSRRPTKVSALRIDDSEGGDSTSPK